MGIDLIRGGRIANRGSRTTKSPNSYLHSLIKVPHPSASSTPSSPAGPTPSSIQSSPKDSTNRGSTATLSPSRASLNTSPMIMQLSPKVKPSSTLAL